MELGIKRNEVTGGLYCVFQHNGSEYYADLSDIPESYLAGYTNECMIFPSVDGEVTAWDELYCKRNIPITEEALRECVEEFCNTENKEEQL